MLCGIGSRLEEQLVALLSKRPATAQQLHDGLGGAYSIQGIYKELRKLQDQGAVVKVRDRYSLRINWILEVLDLADRMYDSYMQSPLAAQDLLRGSKKQTWRFHTLQSLVTFWTHLALTLSQEAADKCYFESVPHVWFHLAHQNDEAQFLTALRQTGVAYHLVVGGDSPLDRSYEKLLKQNPGERSFGRLARSLPEGYLAVAAEHVVTVKLDAALTLAVEDLFERGRSAAAVDVSRVIGVFRRRSKISLTLEHHPAKAAKLARVFREFLGVV